MPIDPALLKILVCPENKTPVSLASADLINSLNRKIDAGELKNFAGQLVVEKIDGGLIRADGRRLYPVREDIPIMMRDEAIEL
jgi:uncharacterized protein YbaR (Trm112 family)